MLEHHTIVIPQLQKKKAAVLAHHIIVMAMLLLLGVPLRCAWVGLEFGSCSKTRRPNGITDAALRVQIPNAKTRLLTVERQFTASLARRCIRAHVVFMRFAGVRRSVERGDSAGGGPEGTLGGWHSAGAQMKNGARGSLGPGSTTP